MSMPAPLQELLTKLNFLSMLKEGKKPCMHDMSFVDSDSFIGAGYRLIKGENRDNAMMQIGQTISQTIMSIGEYRNNPEFVRLIIKTLYEARQGINTMQVAYKKRPKTLSEIKVCLQNIDIQLEKDEDLLPDQYRKSGNETKGGGSNDKAPEKPSDPPRDNQSNINKNEINNPKLSDNNSKNPSVNNSK